MSISEIMTNSISFSRPSKNYHPIESTACFKKGIIIQHAIQLLLSSWTQPRRGRNQNKANLFQSGQHARSTGCGPEPFTSKVLSTWDAPSMVAPFKVGEGEIRVNTWWNILSLSVRLVRIHLTSTLNSGCPLPIHCTHTKPAGFSEWLLLFWA